MESLNKDTVNDFYFEPIEIIQTLKGLKIVS